MEISNVSDAQIKEFCGIDDDCQLLDIYKASAKAFISNETGLKVEDLDNYADLTMAYLILINDMSLNRDYVVTRDNVNPTVTSILGHYDNNLIA